ncbi:WGxxGxxG family protein [Pseudalkalibacillus salsuginis]|uniref:WGxxGxxG family protein n=1 Tax=Pseudalkalibacillus salsuginis TaxID=2910972 RepID=UPI001F45F4A1|nr:WGxxGxxG family protein [Pseudalkalibacillus salsuginis]MCF6411540.1 WGxxGxxG-CTERM domain-containing protein [Pseudalkalibacillus salsuginis]
MLNKKLIAVLFTMALVFTSLGAPALATGDDDRIMNEDNGDRIGTGVRTNQDNDRVGIRDADDRVGIRETGAPRDRNWEWIGLAGLLGLLGLRRREDRRVTD